MATIKLRTRQCPARERGNLFLLICVLDTGHEGRHRTSDGGTWLRGQSLKGSAPKTTKLGTIHIVMTRSDGGEEGNQWEFSGDDDELYTLFEMLCSQVIGYPFVVEPE